MTPEPVTCSRPVRKALCVQRCAQSSATYNLRLGVRRGHPGLDEPGAREELAGLVVEVCYGDVVAEHEPPVQGRARVGQVEALCLYPHASCYRVAGALDTQRVGGLTLAAYRPPSSSSSGRLLLRNVHSQPPQSAQLQPSSRGPRASVARSRPLVLLPEHSSPLVLLSSSDKHILNPQDWVDLPDQSLQDLKRSRAKQPARGSEGRPETISTLPIKFPLLSIPLIIFQDGQDDDTKAAERSGEVSPSVDLVHVLESKHVLVLS
eukprot:746888-Hanusia_phi.AAC.3